MNVRNLLLAGLAAGALLPLAPAYAQTPPPPAGPPLSYGPPITGFCTFSQNQIIGTSKIGQAMIARLKVLDAQWHAELQPQADALNTDKHALDAQASTLDRATYDARVATLQLRAANFEKLVQQREQEMQATQQKQLGIVLQKLDPVLRTLFQSHQCTILVERENGGVTVVNPIMDLSVQAKDGIDQIATTITFDREHLDAQPGGPPAGQ
jgi:Skp family chaperone for outer membrane proteins